MFPLPSCGRNCLQWFEVGAVFRYPFLPTKCPCGGLFVVEHGIRTILVLELETERLQEFEFW